MQVLITVLTSHVSKLPTGSTGNCPASHRATVDIIDATDEYKIAKSDIKSSDPLPMGDGAVNIG
jgi:hypothetical protein